MHKLLKTFIAPLVFVPMLSWAQADSTLQQIQPEQTHPATLREIVKSLAQKHYKKVTINDALSSDLLDSYIKALDPGRSYFYRSDIERFETLRRKLDNEIKKGSLASGFEIYNTFQKRLVERVDYAVARLQDTEKFNFELDERFQTDREEATWVNSQKSMNDLWRKRLKSSLLNLTLADKDLTEARETLIKRFENQKKRVLQTNSEDVFQTYVNSFTKLYDPHTNYFSPRNSENFNINMRLSLQGIGAVLQNENEYTQIVRLIPSGPADKTGKLKANDKIVAVGQGESGPMEDIVGWRLDDVVDRIRGEKGTSVRLEIIPSGGSDQRRETVLIKRNTVKLEEQAAQKRIIKETVDGKEYKIGVIEIPTFYIDFAALQRGEKNYKSTTRDVEKLIKELQTESIDGLIVDLRDNGGGALQEANQLVGLFIRQGATVQIKYYNGQVSPLGDRDPEITYTGPLAVMVNRQSASASEIFAGAIQDYRRGIIIGSQTFGKGTVQTLSPLKHGQLKFTNAKFYRISGESTQNKGVMPDISLPNLFDAEEYGESALDNALPWDTVRAVRSYKDSDLSPLFSQLNQRKDARISSLPDFTYIDQKINHAKAQKEKTELSLNRAIFEENIKKEKQWQLDAENARRVALKLPPIDDLDKIEEDSPKDSLGRPISAQSEAMLQESARILIDMKNILPSRG
ncbi:MAG: carboxy terminal-processing peptidase [Pseudomonadales bacterium]